MQVRKGHQKVDLVQSQGKYERTKAGCNLLPNGGFLLQAATLVNGTVNPVPPPLMERWHSRVQI